MIQQFTLVLKNEKAKTYTLMSWLLIALNGVSFLYLGFTGFTASASYPFVAAGILFCIYLVKLTRKPKIGEDMLVSLCFCLVMVTWIIFGFYWAAAINLVLFIFQDIARRKLVVLFFEDRIIYPSFPKRTIQWHELNNVILKDDLLTIDLKNDKIFQNEIIPLVNEDELNEFCNRHIEALIKN